MTNKTVSLFPMSSCDLDHMTKVPKPQGLRSLDGWDFLPTTAFPERSLTLLVAKSATRKKGNTDVIYHGTKGLSDIAQTVKNAVFDIGPYKRRFDFIAVTGMSGVLVGSPVSIQLGVPLVVIRKAGDNSHSWKPLINSDGAHGRYLFIDDFVAMGKTFRRLWQILDNWEAPNDIEYAGGYFYESRALSWDGDHILSFSNLQDDTKWNVCFDAPERHLADAA